MNLCGGITGISDHELTLQIPDEEFNSNPRKKKFSSMQNRRSKSSSIDQSMLAQTSLSNQPSSRSSRGLTSVSLKEHSSAKMSATPSSMLNPVSRHDYEKFKSRHRSQPLPNGRKSSSILMKKLESGFNLTWLNRGNKKQHVNLSTNSDKSYLRIRFRSRDEEESENDGSRINRGDIKIKVRHISRVGSEKDTTPVKGGDDHGLPDRSKKNTHFVLKMKHAVGENKFAFLAQSLAERDTVVLAIRSLIDPGKHSEASRTKKGQPIIDHKIWSEERNKNILQEPAEIGEQSKESREDKSNGRENISTEFNTENTKIFTSTNLADSMENKNITTDSHGNGLRVTKQNERDSNKGNDIDRKVHSSFVNKPMITKKQLITKSMRRPIAKIEKNDLDSSKSKTFAKKDTIIDGNSCLDSSLGISSTKLLNKNQKSRSPKELQHGRHHHSRSDRRKITMDGITDSVLYESFACNPIGCQSQALAAVEDGDIANIAAACTNSGNGPWCTDDVCTASLKDFADSMKGIFELKQSYKEDTYTDDENQRVVMEEYISGFLSNSKNMSELLSVKDIWNVAALKHSTGKELKSRRLHNRARNADGKAIRLKNLRKRMTFKGADTKKMTFLQTISSFDDINRKEKLNKKKSTKSIQSSVIKFDHTEDSELLYYDSDPEDARERTMKCGPRVVMARREVSLGNETNPRRKEALNILDSSRFGLGRKWKRLGQEVLFDIIEATKNEKLTLIWHPTQNDQSSNIPPICVKVWVEPGVYLTDGTFLLPKLTWLPVHETNLNIRVLNVSDDTPGSLDLLDVCRVRECESIDRKLHPFAHVERSFVIQTQKGNYMFEAQSKQERGRIVNGLKLVIARLASLLMLRDLRAVDEFFGGNAVPGEAPV